MAHHIWGDGFDFEGLNQAQDFIVTYVYKHSLCRLSTKEKYGTIRYEFINSPGCHYPCGRGFGFKIPFVKKYIKILDQYSPIWWWYEGSWLAHKWNLYGWKTTFKAAKLAVNKWPQFEDEILEDIASQEGLVGTELHRKYWKSL